MLVDPGPESSLHTLLEKIGDQRPEAILLTHIHLDHAAATGAMVARWPDLPVYVHERGAPHIIDPSRLLASRRAPLRRQTRVPLGEDPAGPGGQRDDPRRRRDRPRHARRLHAGPRLPPRLLPPRGDRHRLRRRRRRLPHPADRPGRSRRPRPRTSTSSSGKSRSTSSRPGRRRSSPSPTSARSTTRPPTSPRPAPPARGGRAGPRDGRAHLRGRPPDAGSPPSSTPRSPTRCSRPSRPPTSGPASTATGARKPRSEASTQALSSQKPAGCAGKCETRERQAQVGAHALDGLFDPVVGGGERDAEEALAAGAVHRAG